MIVPRFTIRDILIWTFLVAVLAAGVTSVYRHKQRAPLIFTSRNGEPAPLVKVK